MQGWRLEGTALTLTVSADPPSPCRQVCLLQRRICTGCGRSLDEIAAWPTASAETKHAILRAASARLGTA